MSCDIQIQLLAIAANEEEATGCMMSRGKPARWWETPRWRCPNDHVSRYYVRGEYGNVCPACGADGLWLTFPEDRDGPLVAPERVGEGGDVG